MTSNTKASNNSRVRQGSSEVSIFLRAKTDSRTLSPRAFAALEKQSQGGNTIRRWQWIWTISIQSPCRQNYEACYFEIPLKNDHIGFIAKPTEAYLGHARKIFSNTGSVIANTDLVITNTDLVITNMDPMIANTDLVITNTDPVITNTDPVIA